MKRSASPTPLHYPEAGPAAKKTKKSKKQWAEEDGRQEEEEEPEKRIHLYKKKCPKDIEERVERVLTQRFYCIERTRTSETSEDFKVLGSTGNVYTVTYSKIPICSCPDAAKKHHCKHMLFVALKILHIPLTSNLYYQKALITNELQAIFANAPRDRADPTTDRLRTVYKLATGQIVPDPNAAGGSAGTPAKRLPADGDSCPICYEDFEAGQSDGLVFCESIQGCGNGLHKECFSQWASKNPGNVTCVFCRAKWTSPVAAPKPGGATMSEGYMNLAAQAGISRVRDTSTYYHGPQKGKKWNGGYGRYGGGFGRW